MTLPGHRLPTPLPELCTTAVLVTSRVDSAPIDSAEPSLGAVLVEGICRQVFTYGALHADPHPGNFGVTPDREIALYDFGCVKYLDEPTREAMRAMIAAALERRWSDVHAAMERIGAVPPGRWDTDSEVYAAIYARHAAAALDPLRAQPLYRFTDDGLIESIRSEVVKSLKYWKYFNAVPEMVFVMRTLSGLYWILRRMHAEAPLFATLEAIAAGDYAPPTATETPQTQAGG